MVRSWLKRALTPPRPPDPEATPSWVAALLDAVQKSARAQARLALRLDDLEAKLEGGFAELRQAAARPAPVSGTGPLPRPDELFDAMDLLELAATSAEATDPALAQGLRGILARLDRVLSQAAFVRRSTCGIAPDGKVFRVVGTEQAPGLPEGVISRVVRAAVLRGDQVFREGEVITNRKDP